MKSIIDGYAADPHFRDQGRSQRRAELKRQADQQTAEERRRKQVEETRQQDQRREEDAYWTKLTPNSRPSSDAKALAEASQSSRETYLH